MAEFTFKIEGRLSGMPEDEALATDLLYVFLMNNQHIDGFQITELNEVL